MSDTTPEIELKPGDTVGERYRVVRALGKGGIGVVYEAENTWTKRRVAIKLLQLKVANDPEQVERFRQEAQTTSGLRHPNIVDILDMGPDPITGRLFMVQELLDGETLQSLIERRKRLAPREAFDVMVPVMGALAAAHARGVLHRDIKPGNIFLAKDTNGDTIAKIIDFGLARLLNDDPELRKTRTGSIVGTPYYMSPEQARGESGIDARIDVWAVGAVLYELLTGTVPFDGENALAVMWKIASESAPRVDSLVPDVPRGVADLVASALKNKRDERYASMEAFLSAAFACDALTHADAPTLSILHARSLPPELARRASAPGLKPPPPKHEDSLAFRPTHPSPSPLEASPSPLEAQGPAELRSTPFGWTSQQSTSTRRARWLIPVVVGAIVAAVAVPVLGPLVRAPTGAATRAATGTPQPTASSASAEEQPRPVPIPSPITPPHVALPTEPSSPPEDRPGPSAVAQVPTTRAAHAPRSARGSARAHTARTATIPQPSATQPTATVAGPTQHRSHAYDPEQLIDDTSAHP